MSKEKLIEQRLQKKRKQEGKEMLLAESFKRMIWEELEQKLQGILLERESPEIKLDFSSLLEKTKQIPDVQITELGLAEIKQDPSQDIAISTSERTNLVNYLKNIGGNTIKEKIESINAFYEDPNVFIEAGQESAQDKVSAFISYITFLKTLTKIITNFNPSSAGFTYEAFLATAAGGKQIPTNTKTALGTNQIADFITGTGDLYSLKLYGIAYFEGSTTIKSAPEAGGSFTDLAGSVLDAGEKGINYLVSGKNFTGEGLQMNGEIISYEFNLNVNNIVSTMLDKGGVDNRRALTMPKQTFMRKYKDNPIQAIENIIGTLAKDLDIEAARDRLNKISKDDFVNRLDAKTIKDKNKLKKILEPSEWEDYRSDLLNRLETDEKLQSVFNPSTTPTAADRSFAVRDLSAIPSFQKLIAKTPEAREYRGNAGLSKDSKAETILNTVFYTTRAILFPESEKKGLSKKQIIQKIWGDPKEGRVIEGPLTEEKLKLTLGYHMSNSFKFSWKSIKGMGTPIATLNIGLENLQKTVDRFTSEARSEIKDITELVFTMFSILSKMTDQAHKYTSDGLQLEDGKVVQDSSRDLGNTVSRIGGRDPIRKKL